MSQFEIKIREFMDLQARFNTNIDERVSQHDVEIHELRELAVGSAQNVINVLTKYFERRL